MIDIKRLLDKPKVVSVVADVNQGKSMLLYDILENACKEYNYNLYYYGLRLDFDKVNSQRIYSIAELEDIRDSVIIVDELSSLFDMDNRKIRKSIENTLRLINHNNNILILCGVPENFKKFIAAKVDMVIYKKCTLADFVNGSVVKQRLLNYNGYERGTELLNLLIDEAIFYDGKHYKKFNVKYYAKYDTKKSNQEILRLRKSSKKSSIKCGNNVHNKEIKKEVI